MKQSDIDERVKELTTEAEMLGKQKRMLELLEECSKYGYEVELVDAHHPDLFDGPPYVTLRCKRSGIWCTVGNMNGGEAEMEGEWEPSTWYFPDGIFGDGWVKVSDIWEGIEPPAPQLKEESLSSGQQTLDEYTDTKVESVQVEDGTYRVSWGGLGKEEANE